MICAIFNTFGRGNAEKIDRYIEALESILQQKDVEMDVVLSACCPSDDARYALFHMFKNKMAFNYINEVVPLGVSFNSTVRAVQDPKYDAYLYIDSGMNPREPTTVARLYARHKSGPFAMTGAKASNDMGFGPKSIGLWDIPQEPGLTILKPPLALNLHFQLFDKCLLDYYGRLLPDIFANDCSESIFCYMCAALSRQFVIDQDNIIDHLHSMDGASSGSRAGFLLGRPGTTRDDFTPIYERGKEFGLGFEGCDPEGRWPHDPAKFSEEGFALDDRLREFIRRELFTDFDYSKLPTEFIPRQSQLSAGN